MARLSPMAALSRQRPLHLPSPLPPPACACSSSAVLCAARVCPNPATSSSSSCSGVVVSSSSAFSSPLPLGTGRKRSEAAANAYTCFREESALYPRGGSNPLSCEQERNGSLGWWGKRTAGSVCCGGAGGGVQVGVKQVEEELESDGDVSVLDLESEIYDFMQKSSKPSDFPGKDELLAGGRVDLVEAIVAHGGWLAYGWDLDDDEAPGRGDVGEGKREKVCGGEPTAGAVNSHMPETSSATMRRSEPSAGWVDIEILQQQSCSYAMGSAAAVSSRASSSGRPTETKGAEGSGIEGILSRLEKERSFIYTLDSKDMEVDNRFLSKMKDYDLGSAVGGMARGSRSISLDSNNQFFPDFDGGEIFPNGKVNNVENLNDIRMDDYAYLIHQSTGLLRNGREEPSSVAVSNQDQIHSRLQHLESELASVLGSLRSGADVVVSHKDQESSLEELHRLSDAWEFQETKIMNARDKLRSTRAKLAVLEGKMALEIIEAQKIVEAKQKRIEAAQRALRLLRTTYVVWPNSASEVLLAGSFDGWSSQRRMERSSTGIFSLHLKLYPGQYEIKFIVDGVWKVDPLRPIVHNNGFENNLLIIS